MQGTSIAGRLQQEGARRSCRIQECQRKNDDCHHSPWELHARCWRVLVGIVLTRRRLRHRESDRAAQRAQERLREPPGSEAPPGDDGASGDDQEREGDDLNGARTCLDPLEVRFAVNRYAGTIEQRLIGSRPEGVGNRDQQAGANEAGDAFGQPAANHAGDLKKRSENRGFDGSRIDRQTIRSAPRAPSTRGRQRPLSPRRGQATSVSPGPTTGDTGHP